MSKSFQLRDLQPQGWSELNDEYPSRRFDQREITEYLAICRQKAVATLASETRESLSARRGFIGCPSPAVNCISTTSATYSTIRAS
jgi:hypothetical protein